MMTKAWQADGLQLYAVQRAALTMLAGEDTAVLDSTNANYGADRPLNVLEMYLDLDSNTTLPICKLSRREYYRLSNRSATGIPTQFYYDKLVKIPTLYVWPVPQKTSTFDVFIQRTLEDFDAATDEADFPQEWFLPLALGLAVLIAPKYGVPAQEYRQLQFQAETWYERAKDFDSETGTSIFFRPNEKGRDD